MRVFLYILLFLELGALALGCVNNQKKVSAKDSSETMESLTANIVGLYFGQLPCVDCESINTYLELHRDHTYTLRYMYEGKSDDLFVKEGKWDIKDDKLSLKGVDYQYRVERDKLVQLDLTGNEIKGDLADQYILGRIE